MSNVSNSSSAAAMGAARGVAEAVREKGKEVRDTLHQAGSAAKEAAQSGWEAARHTAGEYLGQGREKAMAFEHSVEGQIKARPLGAILVAGGIGFLIGMLLRR